MVAAGPLPALPRASPAACRHPRGCFLGVPPPPPPSWMRCLHLSPVRKGQAGGERGRVWGEREGDPPGKGMLEGDALLSPFWGAPGQWLPQCWVWSVFRELPPPQLGNRSCKGAAAAWCAPPGSPGWVSAVGSFEPSALKYYYVAGVCHFVNPEAVTI